MLFDDRNYLGHFNRQYFPVGLMLQCKYSIQYVLSQGSSSVVYCAVDVTAKTNRRVAIKAYEDVSQAHRELMILSTIRKLDAHGVQAIIRLKEFFQPFDQLCMVLPLMSSSIRDFQQSNSNYRFSIRAIKSIGHQLCGALSFLHRNAIVHTKIDSSNIVLLDDAIEYVAPATFPEGIEEIRQCVVKIIDFSSAVKGMMKRPVVVQSKPYRSPEVILELAWSNAIDIWSLGCVLHELYVGHHELFNYASDLEHLAAIQWFFGAFPDWMRMNTSLKTTYFRGFIVNHPKPFDFPHFLREANQRFLENVDEPNHGQFFRLVEKMLTIDPVLRITASEALEDAFFDDTEKSYLSCFTRKQNKATRVE